MSKSAEAAEARLLSLARTAVPNARINGFASRDAYSCVIIVETDIEKARINGNAGLLSDMKNAAAALHKHAIHLVAESQETVDRRWGGDWNFVFR